MNLCGHYHSGDTNPLHFISSHTMRGYFMPAQVSDNIEQIKRDSFPTGTNHPYSLIMGNKGGLLSSTTTINGEASLTANAAQGINILSTINGTSSISVANLSLIVSLATSIAGSGDITTASLVGTVALATVLSGSGAVTAGLSLISFLNSTINGTGTVNADLKGKLSMAATIYVNESEATVQQIVAGVWNALTADYNATGTMGEAMGAAGTAGDPWTTSLPGAYGAGTAGNIIGNLLANIPDSVWDELKTTHNTSSSYGKIVQDLETLAKQIKALTSAQL